jgi:hypothetical protein
MSALFATRKDAASVPYSNSAIFSQLQGKGVKGVLWRQTATRADHDRTLGNRAIHNPDSYGRRGTATSLEGEMQLSQLLLRI